MNLRHINDYETISYLLFHIYRRSFHLPARLAGQRNTDTSSSGPNNHHHRKVTYNKPYIISKARRINLNRVFLFYPLISIVEYIPKSIAATSRAMQSRGSLIKPSAPLEILLNVRCHIILPLCFCESPQWPLKARSLCREYAHPSQRPIARGRGIRHGVERMCLSFFVKQDSLAVPE